MNESSMLTKVPSLAGSKLIVCTGVNNEAVAAETDRASALKAHVVALRENNMAEVMVRIREIYVRKSH